jgi:two-component system response regulator RegA
MIIEDCALHEPRPGGDNREPRPAAGARPRLLLVDDNENHCWALTRAFEKRGYAVKAVHSAATACALVEDWPAEYAIVDLRMPGPSGLTLIPRLKAALPGVRIVMLTGYASIATAVEAIKLGATQYLVKPVDAPTLEAAFRDKAGDTNIPSSDHLLSVERMEWEYIQRVLSDQHGNVSATARALNMHRKTLQRKLSKHPPGGSR